MPRRNRLTYRMELRDMVARLKHERGCKQCGEDRAPALEFHHRDPTTKTIAVSNAISQDKSVAFVLAEIEKCDCICKNCHSMQHSVYDKLGRRRRGEKGINPRSVRARSG